MSNIAPKSGESFETSVTLLGWVRVPLPYWVSSMLVWLMAAVVRRRSSRKLLCSEAK
jgi:hypothetical protein